MIFRFMSYAGSLKREIEIVMSNSWTRVERIWPIGTIHIPSVPNTNFLQPNRIALKLLRLQIHCYQSHCRILLCQCPSHMNHTLQFVTS